VLTGEGVPGVTLAASEEATFECSIDGGAWTDCSSGLPMGSLGADEHTLAVVATDADGNTDPTPATATWELRLR
jgi:hypothetical protein